jgi:hypothetical protein
VWWLGLGGERFVLAVDPPRPSALAMTLVDEGNSHAPSTARDAPADRSRIRPPVLLGRRSAGAGAADGGTSVLRRTTKKRQTDVVYGETGLTIEVR